MQRWYFLMKFKKRVGNIQICICTASALPSFSNLFTGLLAPYSKTKNHCTAFSLLSRLISGKWQYFVLPVTSCPAELSASALWYLPSFLVRCLSLTSETCFTKQQLLGLRRKMLLCRISCKSEKQISNYETVGGKKGKMLFLSYWVGL